LQIDTNNTKEMSGNASNMQKFKVEGTEIEEEV
jgi:hypothetical protein